MKIKKILLNTLKELKTLVPIFFLAVLLGEVIERYLPDAVFDSLLGRNLLIAIPLATIIGIIFPIPRYATYPIAFALFLKGSGYGVAFALISGEVIGESVVRDLLEVKYFGLKFFTTRFVLSTIFIIAGAFIIEGLI